MTTLPTSSSLQNKPTFPGWSTGHLGNTYPETQALEGRLPHPTIPHTNDSNVLSSDKNIQLISDLLIEIKRYAEIQKEGFRIDLTLKLTKLLTALIVGMVFVLMTSVMVLMLSFALSHLIAPLVGSLALAYALIGALYLLIAVVVYTKRKPWLEQPLADFLAGILLEQDHHENEAGSPPSTHS